MRIVAALPLFTMAVPAVAAEAMNEVDRVAAHFAQAPITGMTIAIARNGKLLHAKGYGMADAERGIAAGRNTIYEAGSIAKTFTAAAIFRFAEQGGLTLDDPVAKHFPELAEAAKGVTLRHLLEHSSGLFSGNLAADLTKPFDTGSVAQQLGTKPREFAPGERFRYNNNGYLLLGLLIERVSGLPYHQFLHREFIRPLGLRDTGACADVAQPRRAKAYVHPERGGAKPAQHPIHHPGVSFSAGALCSTALDLAKWQQALIAGKILRAESKAAMTTPAILNSGKASPYGMGMFVDEAGGELRLHHGGASSGFITQMGAYPKDSTVVVVLTNGIYAGSLVEQIEAAALKASRGESVTFVADLPTSAAERASYVGIYELGPMKLEVFELGSHLRAKPPGQVAARLLHQGGHEFVAEHDPSLRFRFQRSRDGVVLLMAKNGRELPPARRIAEQAYSDSKRLVEDLLAADRAHAEQARTSGLNGLLAMFDDEVLMPSPHGALVRGKAEVTVLLRQSSQDAEGRLSWTPIRAGISADGSHGFTLGYMDVAADGSSPRTLKYLSYWQKKAGQWKVVAFKRAPHIAGQRTAMLAPSLPAIPTRKVGDFAAEQLALALREQAFSDAAAKVGLGKAFATFGQEDAVNFGRSAGFSIGAEVIGRELEASGLPKLAWKADGALVAPSGDLGLTWGKILASDNARSTIPFFTVWRRNGTDGEWLYVAE